MPIRTRSSRPPTRASGKSRGSIRAASPSIPACRVSMPTKMSPNPARARPTCANRPRASRRVSAPSPMSGSARPTMLNLRPSRETSHPVLVVPRLAPRMTPTACWKLNSPALTNPMVVRVVALDDCTTAVMVAPAARDLKRPPVNRARNPRRESPASAFSPSVSRIMPRRKRPMPPRMVESIVPKVVITGPYQRGGRIVGIESQG